MRTGILLIRRHGEPGATLASGPALPLHDLAAAFKAAVAEHGKMHPEIAEIQLWESDAGITKRARFSRPAVQPPVPPPETQPVSESLPEAQPASPPPAPVVQSAPKRGKK